MLPQPDRPVALRIALTLLLAGLAAQLCVALKTPLPWMLGPLLATALASLLGAPTQSWLPLRNLGQWTFGSVLGLYFTPQVSALVWSFGWAIVLGIVWALVLGWAFGWWLQRVNQQHLPDLERATSYFAGAIGGASEMTLLAEREGAQTELVAAAHSLRLLIVTVTIPFAMQFSGLHGLDLTPPGPRSAAWPGLLWLALATGAGAGVMQWLGRANPWFMGALLTAMALTMQGIYFSAVPTALSNAAQLVIGVSLGVRFTAGFIRTAPRWLGTVAAGTLVMLAMCAAFGWLLSGLTGVHPATLILGTAPGGIAEMAITAKVLQLGAPVVTAFQVCRLVAVLVLVEPLYLHYWRKSG